MHESSSYPRQLWKALSTRVSAPVFVLVIALVSVAASIFALWRLHALKSFAESSGFQVTTFVLAVLAIIFGSIQFWDARKHSEKMELVAGSMSTRFLGIFPKDMDEIIELIKLAEKELIIVSDFVDYGAYSRPEAYKLLFDEIMKARERGVLVRWLVYAEGPARETLAGQFNEAEFAQTSVEQKFVHYFDYWSGIHRPKCYADFQKVLCAKENDFADDLVDKGVKIHTLSEKVWLFFFMQDEQDAIFLFEDIGSSNQGLAFRTRDAKLVETFAGIFNRYWDPAPSRPRAHRSGQVAVPIASAEGGR